MVNIIVNQDFSASKRDDKKFTRPSGLLYNLMRKAELAKKVMDKKRLSNIERQEIYFYLTDNQPPAQKGKGRPPKRQRDFELAWEYLDALDRKIWGAKLADVRSELKKKYGLSGADNTFYSALTRGRAHLKTFAEGIIQHIDENRFPSSNADRAQDLATDIFKKLELADERADKLKPKHLS